MFSLPLRALAFSNVHKPACPKLEGKERALAVSNVHKLACPRLEGKAKPETIVTSSRHKFNMRHMAHMSESHAARRAAQPQASACTVWPVYGGVTCNSHAAQGHDQKDGTTYAFVKSSAQGTKRYAFKYVHNFPPPTMFKFVVLDDI